MAGKIYVGNIPQSRLEKTREYAKKHFPGADIFTLSALQGVKGILANRIKQADVDLVVLSEEDIAEYGVIAEKALNLSKSIKFTDLGDIDDYFRDNFKIQAPKAVDISEIKSVVDNEKAALQAEIEQLKSEINDLNVKLFAKSDYDNLKAEITDLRGELAEKADFIPLEDYTKLKKDLEQKQYDYDYALEQNSDLQDRIDKLNSAENVDNKEFSAKITILEKALEESENTLKKAVSERDTLQAQLDSVGKENSEETANLLKELASLKAQKFDLEAKLEELSKAENESSKGFSEKIDILEKMLEKAENSLKKVNSERDILQAQLDSLGKENSEETANLLKNLAELKEQKSELETKLADISEQLGALQKTSGEITEKNGDLQEELDNISQQKSEQEKLAKETKNQLNLVISEKQLLNSKLKEVEIANEELNNQLSELKILLEKATKESENNSTKNEVEIADLQVKIKALTADFEAVKKEQTELMSEKENLSTELSEKTKTASELELKLSEFEVKSKKTEGLIAELKGQLNLNSEENNKLITQKDTEIKNLKDEIEGLQLLADSEADEAATEEKLKIRGELNRALHEKETAETELRGKSKELLQKNKELADALSAKTEEINKNKAISKEVNELKRAIQDLEHGKSLLEMDITQKTAIISNKSEEIEQISNENREEIDRRYKAESEVNALKLKLQENDIQLEKSQRDLAVLSEKIKLVDNTDTTVLTLRKDYDTAVIERDNYKQEAELLKDKVAAYAKQISDTMNMGVFSELGANTQPKQAVKADLKLVQSAYAKLCVTGCIGGASIRDSYDVIKRIADYITGEALVVDLCTDTYIDDVYKGLKIKNPVEWLQGSKKISEVICDTNVKNVKVVSLASAYTNPTYLVTVNWDILLSDLAMKYNFVVLNVGNLDSLIAQVLYTSFSKVMNGRIVVRGTPATLRAAYIRLAGMGDMQNTVVLCSEYRSDSKILGDKIKQKYNFEPVGARGPIDVI